MVYCARVWGRFPKEVSWEIDEFLNSKKGSFVLHSLSRTTTVFLQNVLTKRRLFDGSLMC